MDMSDNTAPADGGKKIIILCEKVSKEDIKVRFSDYNGWEEWADFGAGDVHKQYAISFKVPRYQNINICEPVKVCVELVKPSDDTRSEEEEFYFTPVHDQKIKAPVVEAKMEVTPTFVHNGGGFVTEVKNELNDPSAWKQMTSQAGQMTVKTRVDPYSKVVLNDAGLGLSGVDYGQVPISGGYEYNIPVTNNILSTSPYLSHSQSSPDSQGLADLNISSPGQSYQTEVSHSDLVKILGPQDDEMQNLSDKLDEFSLGHGAPLNICPVTTTSSRVGGKRSSKEAENDSASILIPRQMERQQSSISTPNVSTNLSEILQNCKQINDLS